MANDVIDLEEYANLGECVPKGKYYKVKIDKEKYLVKSETITGQELLELASKTPANCFELQQKFKNGDAKEVELCQVIDLTESGIEKFNTFQRGYQIIVNAQPKVVDENLVTFEQIVELAYPGTTEPNVVFTMTYRRVASKPHSGELGAGSGVEIKKKGSIFNVTKCIKS